LVVKRIVFTLEYWLFNKITNGKNAWKIFDKAEIKGFGINLIRLYFPIHYDKKVARQSFSVLVQKRMTELIKPGKDIAIYHKAIVEGLGIIAKLPVQQTDNIKPYLDNYYFGVCDAAVLFAIIQTHKPGKIVEIGSGISTRYMRHFKDRLALNTQIVCIDPAPRVDVMAVADSVIEDPFENVITGNVLNLQAGDIVFMDGSHYVFQGNDTLSFFFDFLPSLPAGVIIHIHDIYLPCDYPEKVEKQLWTEQYILAALMIGGFVGFETIYPVYHISQTDSDMKEALTVTSNLLSSVEFNSNINHTEGYSFWMRKV